MSLLSGLSFAAFVAATQASLPAPSPPPQVRFSPAFPRLSFANPVWIGSVKGSTDMLVAELGGAIHLFPSDPNITKTRVVLDLSKRVAQRNFVEGLLGFALHPRWPTKRDLWIFYAARNDKGPAQAVLSRFSWPRGAPTIDPKSEHVLLAVDNPNTLHHGGDINFGPDGFLYLSVGDMGPQNDPDNVSQNLASLRGKILRIDIDGEAGALPYRIPPDNPFVKTENARPEVWAFGFRNPYRFSFDPANDTLWLGDVGQVTEEEINIVTRGGNYGWNIREGRFPHVVPTRPDAGAPLVVGVPPFVEPVISYGRKVGGSVTAGAVYRGKKLPELDGTYIYADWLSSTAFFIRHDGKHITAHGTIGKLTNPNTFGVDDAGELMALTMDGRIMRLEAGAPIPATTAYTSISPSLSEDALRTLTRSPGAVARGRDLFMRGCQACHGLKGEGGIGPNLTDAHWLHGSSQTEIGRSISVGNPATGMPAWSEVYASDEINALASFVASLSRHPAVGKPPQGKVAPISYPVAQPTRRRP